MKPKIFNLSKKEITQIPFQLVYEDGKNGTDQRKAFAKYSTWALPQALAFIGNIKPIKDENGNYDASKTAKAFVNSSEVGSEWAKGLLYYLISHPRGLIFPLGVKASSAELIQYAALVPLFLAAFKRYQNINYAEWVNFESVVDPDLFAAMTCTAPHYSVEELLSLRELGTTIKSGDKAGTIKNPLSATSLTSTGFDEFDKLPRLAKIMLTQVWIAHPTLRHKYMVLNPNSWDDMPDSLINTEVIKSATTKYGEWDE